MSDIRRYGYFKCPTCKREWESAHAWCNKTTYQPSAGQQCQNADCPRDYIKPYKVERLRCPKCGSNTGCVCHLQDFDDDDYNDDDSDDNERHNNPAKPHRSDLCQKCRQGKTCKFR